jgi:hypothetical protein
MDAFDIICVLERGIMFRKGLVFGDQPGTKSPENFLSLCGSAGALGFMYLHMVKFGSGFVSRLVDITNYFQPLDLWADDPH